MNKIDQAAAELREMDDLAAMSSPVHSLHPLTKLFLTVFFIFVTVSFHKYDLSGLMIMVLYPVLMFQISGVPVRTCFYKLRIVLPLVMAVGILNPFFDRETMLMIGNVPVSGGVISMVTLMLKGVFCLMASFILAATTPIEAICAALRKLYIPSMIVTLLLLTYRYVSVMIDEVSVMTTAYELRAPGQRGVHYKAWGSFLGQLLLRSMDRAEDLYASMQLRGFAGEFYYADVATMRAADLIVMVIAASVFILFRFTDPVTMLGTLVTGGR